ncbi:MAG: acyl-CoA dehydrogenase family protein [Actinomycetaceae bacterium]|nr:acyl-CoA dehydrogenase family protein [Actinomycetaceae bacterium]
MSFIPAGVLERIHQRAARHDQENSFPFDDLQDLRECGYLTAFVPAEFGGAGLTLAEICQAQTDLAKAAPGTALGINMHHIIVGLGRHLHRHGESGGETILRAAAAGDLFGFGISEPGNDLVLFGSITRAEPQTNGDYRLYGRKIFTSLAPAWTKLATFGCDSSDPEDVRNVFGLLQRDSGGINIVDDWDTMGMRATQSNSTELNGAVVKAEHVLAKVTPGPSAHPVVFGIFAYFEILLAATYRGLGQRALELAAETVKSRHSVRRDAPYATDPDIRWRIASAAIAMDAVDAPIELAAQDIENGVDRGVKWMPQLSALKHRTCEAAKYAVEEAVRASGGSSYYNSKELSRLYRDVLAGLFQPSDAESVHGAWASLLLGPLP